MTTPIPFVPDRFKDNAAHYLGGRAAYSPHLIRRVAQTCKLDGTQRLLDLGCGPGQISLAFSTWIGAGVAIDPAPEMLNIASGLGLGVAPNIEYRLGSSYDLSPELGQFHVAVIGRAFHWMDRPDTLARLDKLIAPAGAVVLFSTSHPDDPPKPWFTKYRVRCWRSTRKVIRRVSSANPMSGRVTTACCCDRRCFAGACVDCRDAAGRCGVVAGASLVDVEPVARTSGSGAR